MCFDCVTNAKTIVAGVLPGWDLKKTRSPFFHWLDGSWVLITEDGSSVISWSGQLVQEPLVCQEGDNTENLFLNSVNEFEKAAVVDPKTGWKLIQAVIECGFDPEVDELGSWMIDYLSRTTGGLQ